ACSGASASSNQATTTSSSVSATSPSLPPLSPGGQVLIEASGNHDARTGNFAARAPWYIELRYECTGENDNIVVQVAGDDSRLIGGITEKSVQGQDMRGYHSRGTF